MNLGYVLQKLYIGMYSEEVSSGIFFVAHGSCIIDLIDDQS